MTETAAPIQSASLEARVNQKRKKRVNPYASSGKRAWAYTADHFIISVLSLVFAFVLNIFFPAPPFEMFPPELQITLDASGMPTSDISQIPTKEEAMVMIAEHWVGQLGNFKPLFLLSILLPLVYFSMFAASKWQATPGMRWCKIVVTTRQGVGLSLVQATLRTLAHFLTFLTLGLGFFAMNFNKRRLALHDWISGTEVRNYDPEFEAERQRRTKAAREESMTQRAKALDKQQAPKPKAPTKPAAKRPPAKRRKPATAKKPGAKPAKDSA